MILTVHTIRGDVSTVIMKLGPDVSQREVNRLITACSCWFKEHQHRTNYVSGVEMPFDSIAIEEPFPLVDRVRIIVEDAPRG